MGRIDSDDLREPARVLVASSLRAAQRVEELLEADGVDYAVEVEPIGKSFLFGTPRYGAAFYVASGQADYCRTRLAAAGFAGSIVSDTP